MRLKPEASLRAKSRRPIACSPSGGRLMLAAPLLAGLLAACGGGGGSESNGSTLVTGKVAVATASAARVSCRDGDVERAWAMSDSRGGFQLALAGGDRCERLVAEGGLDVGLSPDDSATHLPRQATVLRAPVPPAGTGESAPQAVVVSPISTLIQARIERGETLEQALRAVREALGISVAVDLLRTDPESSFDLFSLNTRIGLIIDQTRTGLAVAARLTGVAQQQAVGAIVIDTLAGGLPALGRAGLAPDPDTLSPDAPLVRFIEASAQAVKDHPQLGGAATGLNPASLAMIIAPGVAQAASLGDAADAPAIVAWVRQVAMRDQVAIDVHGQSSVAAKSLTGVVAPVAKTTSTSPGEGPDNTAIFLPVAGGGDKELKLFDGATQFVSLDDFATNSSCTAPINLAKHFSKLSFRLGHTPNNEQLSGPRDASFAIDISDEPLTSRRFRAIVDVVRLSLDSNNQVRAQIPDRTNLIVYGKTASAETKQALQIRLGGDALNIIHSANGEIHFDMNRLLTAIDSAVGGTYVSGSTDASAALQFLVSGRVSSGCYKVKLVLGNTRKAKGKKVGDKPVLQMVEAHTISLAEAGGFSLSGYGFTGFVKVTGP